MSEDISAELVAQIEKEEADAVALVKVVRAAIEGYAWEVGWVAMRSVRAAFAVIEDGDEGPGGESCH